MALYRNKPRIVDAEQFHGFYSTPWPRGVEVDKNQCYVTTKHGVRVRVKPGEWIIKEQDGSGYYPCDSDAFTTFYEPVEPPKIASDASEAPAGETGG